MVFTHASLTTAGQSGMNEMDVAEEGGAGEEGGKGASKSQQGGGEKEGIAPSNGCNVSSMPANAYHAIVSMCVCVWDGVCGWVGVGVGVSLCGWGWGWGGGGICCGRGANVGGPLS